MSNTLFRKFMTWLKDRNYMTKDNHLVHHGDWVRIMRTMCRVYRDVVASLEFEGSPGPNDALYHDSVLGAKELETLNSVLGELHRILLPMAAVPL